MTDPEVRDGFFLHEFEEDVEDGSMCVVCGIPDLVHDGAMKKRFGVVSGSTRTRRIIHAAERAVTTASADAACAADTEDEE